MEKFTKVKNIGKGNMGACALARNNEDGRYYVIKQVDLAKLNKKERQQSLNEAKVTCYSGELRALVGMILVKDPIQRMRLGDEVDLLGSRWIETRLRWLSSSGRSRFCPTESYAFSMSRSMGRQTIGVSIGLGLAKHDTRARHDTRAMPRTPPDAFPSSAGVYGRRNVANLRKTLVGFEV